MTRPGWEIGWRRARCSTRRWPGLGGSSCRSSPLTSATSWRRPCWPSSRQPPAPPRTTPAPEPALRWDLRAARWCHGGLHPGSGVDRGPSVARSARSFARCGALGGPGADLGSRVRADLSADRGRSTVWLPAVRALLPVLGAGIPEPGRPGCGRPDPGSAGPPVSRSRRRAGATQPHNSIQAVSEMMTRVRDAAWQGRQCLREGAPGAAWAKTTASGCITW